ncbi:potassium-transporting ATPase subunit C [Bordetella trematum]|uniref:potassium-transporting ATPase subunit KdpC n=1 Tax=Bordetella trematum TaxID=123899 RepID=UPI000C75DF02|nr:potassium-transporting ATPase subunit KdpC [Bordetella trematum]AUL46005.1 potassium-transporting ATPase subunit C [Bordetella trematum]
MSNQANARSAHARPAARGLLRPALISAFFFMVVTGIVYPLATTGAAQMLWPAQAQGSLLLRDGVPVGSRVIGQAFSQAQYFHGRPSATQGVDPADPARSVPQPYNAAASGASNQGALSRQLLGDVAARVAAYRQENGLEAAQAVPVDAVTASASGLDPHISLANARLQAARVAQARQWPEQAVLALLARHSETRQFGLLGEPRVNVLELNLALDEAGAARLGNQ